MKYWNVKLNYASLRIISSMINFPGFKGEYYSRADSEVLKRGWAIY